VFVESRLQSRPLSFSVVLISCLVNELQKRGDAVDPELVAATKEIQLGLVPRSAWNSPVDIHDPMAKVVKLTTSYVRSLQVIAIPRTVKISSQEQEKVVTRFAAFAKNSV